MSDLWVTIQDFGVFKSICSALLILFAIYIFIPKGGGKNNGANGQGQGSNQQGQGVAPPPGPVPPQGSSSR